MGYAGYAAAYPMDRTGCIFVTFNFCPIIWIFGHRLHWMHTQHAMHPCIQTYPSCCNVLAALPINLLTHLNNFYISICSPTLAPQLLFLVSKLMLTIAPNYKLQISQFAILSSKQTSFHLSSTVIFQMNHYHPRLVLFMSFHLCIFNLATPLLFYS